MYDLEGQGEHSLAITNRMRIEKQENVSLHSLRTQIGKVMLYFQCVRFNLTLAFLFFGH